jgi:predicted metal-dependent phosphoesterase TrpH
MVRVDLHVHTSASFDCQVEPWRVLRRCERLGLRPVFVTDHDTIAGAEDLMARRPRAVVTGQEILTEEGQLVGLFLLEAVPPNLPLAEAILRVKRQGGLVYLAHPYDRRRWSLGEAAIERVAGQIDVVEVFNARTRDEENRRAEDLCAILGAAPGAGSDAHALDQIGSVYVEMDDFSGPRDFLVKLRTATIVRRPRRPRLWAEARLQRLRLRRAG